MNRLSLAGLFFHHRNGRLTDQELATITGPHRLSRAAAQDFHAWSDAYRQRFGQPILPTSAYRTIAGQRNSLITYGSMASPVYDTRRRLVIRTAGPARAATVTDLWGASMHGWGKAVDINRAQSAAGSETQRWLAENGPRFGWHWPAWAQRGHSAFQKHEPWHFEHPSDSPVYRGSAPAPRPEPIPDLPEEDTMLIIQNVDTTMAALVFPTGRWSWIHTAEDLVALRDTGLPYARVADKTFNSLTAGQN